MSKVIYHRVFPVFDRPVCLWSFNPERDNLDFLRSLDPDYYLYISATLGKDLSTDADRHAAVGLRSAYLHGLETLFTFLGAALQAPTTVYAWVQRCSTDQLHSVVAAIHRKDTNLLHTLPVKTISWHGLSQDIHAGYNVPPEIPNPLELMGKLWEHFARDFLSEANRFELNNIKHGFRTGFGGFSINIKPNDGSGSELDLSGGKYGSGYYRLAKLDGAPADNITVGYAATNWDPKMLIAALEVISMSINNTPIFLRRINGDDVSKLEGRVPPSAEVLEVLTKWKLGAYNFNFAETVTADNIRNFQSRDEMLLAIKNLMGQIEAKRQSLSNPQEVIR